jgi:hypothetical protein
METLTDSDFYPIQTALISSVENQSSSAQNDVLTSIADELDFDLSFNFLLENENFFHISNDIDFNSISTNQDSSANTTTISDLIDSTPSISDLLQADFSQFDTSEFEAFTAESPDSVRIDLISQVDTPYDSNSNLMSVNPIVFQLEEESTSQFSLACASPASSMTSCASRSVKKSAKNKVISGRVDKKESNKAAATRYRNKKLKEREDLFVECEMYAKKNTILKGKIDDLQTEISFIKSLLVEVLIRKTKV